MKQKNEDDEVVTKGFLKKELEKVDEKAQQYHDNIITRLDGVMKELENMREDNLIGTYQIRELRETTETHEKRITKLERSQKAT